MCFEESVKIKYCKVCKKHKRLEECVRCSTCADGYRFLCKKCYNSKYYIKKGPCKNNPSWFKNGHAGYPNKTSFKKGQHASIKTEFKKGNKPHNFKDGKTDEIYKTIRLNSRRYAKLRKKVFERDNYECQICGKTNKYLHAHHITPLRVDIEMAYDIDNLITVCPKCHAEIHRYE